MKKWQYKLYSVLMVLVTVFSVVSPTISVYANTTVETTESHIGDRLLEALKRDETKQTDTTLNMGVSAVTHEGFLSSKIIVDKQTGHIFVGGMIETEQGAVRRLYQVYVNNGTSSGHYQLTLVDLETGETLAVNVDGSQKTTPSSPFRAGILTVKNRDGIGGFGGSYVGSFSGGGNFGKSLLNGLGAALGLIFKGGVSKNVINQSAASSPASTKQVQVVNDAMDYDAYILRQQRQ